MKPPHPPRRRKRRRQPEHSNHERWLVSYADFITLMFAVFATLYAISTVDAQKLHSMAESAQQAFDPKSAAASSQILVGKQPSPTLSKNAGPGGEVGLADLQNQITKRLAKEVADHHVEIEKDQRGLVISIREAGSFAVGSADLSGDAQALLLEIGSILSGIGNHVLVEGHTDDIPIHTARFASNWELSTTRATNVIAFLLDRAHVSPEHVAAAGYAEHHPKVANSSDANRTRNRRVDLIILNPTAGAEPARAVEPGQAIAHQGPAPK
ncbi:MAG: flagellar motor protein MotB [Acidobacteriota bacterium]